MSAARLTPSHDSGMSGPADLGLAGAVDWAVGYRLKLTTVFNEVGPLVRNAANPASFNLGHERKATCIPGMLQPEQAHKVQAMEGEVFAYDKATNILVLKQSAADGASGLCLLKANFIKAGIALILAPGIRVNSSRWKC